MGQKIQIDGLALLNEIERLIEVAEKKGAPCAELLVVKGLVEDAIEKAET